MAARSKLIYYVSLDGTKVLLRGKRTRTYDPATFDVMDVNVYHGYLNHSLHGQFVLNRVTLPPGQFFFALGRNRYMTSQQFIDEFGPDFHDFARTLYSSRTFSDLISVLRKRSA